MSQQPSEHNLFIVDQQNTSNHLRLNTNFNQNSQPYNSKPAVDRSVIKKDHLLFPAGRDTQLTQIHMGSYYVNSESQELDRIPFDEKAGLTMCSEINLNLIKNEKLLER